ncbi:DUF2892 domain-containing protein [Ectothiorhodospiraceae bacterium 2226]|nr:DUF2892 domain-containing protein [Ectothiorhodospiraceae bacterium 2226]
MINNVGGIDRLLRIVVGLAVLSLVFILGDAARWWGLLGILPLASGLLRSCPPYALLGINTCPVQRRRA